MDGLLARLCITQHSYQNLWKAVSLYLGLPVRSGGKKVASHIENQTPKLKNKPILTVFPSFLVKWILNRPEMPQFGATGTTVSFPECHMLREQNLCPGCNIWKVPLTAFSDAFHIGTQCSSALCDDCMYVGGLRNLDYQVTRMCTCQLARKINY